VTNNLAAHSEKPYQINNKASEPRNPLLGTIAADFRGMTQALTAIPSRNT